MTIKLVASDLDRTLLNNERKISIYTKQVLLELGKHGIHFIPCTARPLNEIPQELLDNPYIPYIVCSNGGLIYDNKRKEIAEHYTISLDKALELLDLAIQINPHWTILTDGVFHSTSKILEDREPLEIHDSYYNFLLESRVFSNEYRSFLNQDSSIEKIHFITHRGEGKEELRQLLSSIKDIEITSSSINNLEILPIHVNKGNSLHWVIQTLGLTKDEAIAFGDNENDVTLFDVTCSGYAVDNATDFLKERATEVILSNDQDGVAVFLNDLFTLNCKR